MKKVISIIAVCLIVAGLVVAGFFIFKTSNVQSIEIVGDIQTIYFVDSTTDVNFNDAELKITYKNGSVKMKKLTKNLVTVSNFSTSIENKGLMKISYKSQSQDIAYAVICKGMYYLTEKNEESFNGSNISSTNSGLLIAGIDENNNDNTTSTEMIYFGDNGICDYYSRESSTSQWYADNGYYNKEFYYNITGNTLNVHLGKSKVYNFVAEFSNDGEMSLACIENEYVTEHSEFLKKRTMRNFKHYEMKGNRTITKEDIAVFCEDEIIFEKNSKFEDSDLEIYVKVVYKNDSFLKTVFVRFTEEMFDENDFSTAYVTPSTTRAECYYNGIRFYLEYKVV